MAYYVTTDGVDQTIEIPAYTFPSTGIVRLYIDEQAFSTNSGYQISVAGSTVRFTLGDFGTADLNFEGATQSVFGVDTAARLGLALEWDFDLNVFRVYVNDVLEGTFAATATMTAFAGATTTTFYWGRRFGTYIQSNVYAIQISESGTLVRDYDPSLSNGTGLVIPESLGGTSAPLINYNPPNDDSQWVFYGASGTTAAITESSQPFTDAIASTVTGNLSAAITELSQPFTDSIVADLAGDLVASITESAQPFTDAITGTVFGNLSAAITETAGVFGSSIAATLTQASGDLVASITETAGLFTDSILTTVTGIISGSITESASAFSDSISASIAIQIDSSIIELNFSFTDSLVASIPATWVNVNPSANSWITSADTTSEWLDSDIPTNPWTNLT